MKMVQYPTAQAHTMVESEDESTYCYPNLLNYYNRFWALSQNYKAGFLLKNLVSLD